MNAFKISIILTRYDIEHQFYSSYSNDCPYFCRVINPLAAAAEVYEKLEDWGAAADMQHALALACDSAGLTERRNAAATAWQRLQDLAKHGFHE